MRQIIFFLALMCATQTSAQKQDTLSSIFQDVRKHYLGLEDTPIKLVFTKKDRHMMWARPTLGSLLFGKMKYKVFVSTDTMYSAFLDTLSRDAIEGWYAHELAHLVDYEKQGKLATIWMGVQYAFLPKGRRAIEHRADRITIEHGYGCELLASVDTSKKHLPANKKKQIERFYYKKAELEKLIRECNNKK